MLFLNDAVFRQLVYEKCVTNSETDAGEALSRGKGVCQDFAHILIGLLRGLGVPARYVTGYIEGEGDSHAWVEAFHEGRWYGLDPTHNTFVREGYIKVAHGRDAKDMRMNSGVSMAFNSWFSGMVTRSFVITKFFAFSRHFRYVSRILSAGGNNLTQRPRRPQRRKIENQEVNPDLSQDFY